MGPKKTATMHAKKDSKLSSLSSTKQDTPLAQITPKIFHALRPMKSSRTRSKHKTEIPMTRPQRTGSLIWIKLKEKHLIPNGKIKLPERSQVLPLLGSRRTRQMQEKKDPHAKVELLNLKVQVLLTLFLEPLPQNTENAQMRPNAAVTPLKQTIPPINLRTFASTRLISNKLTSSIENTLMYAKPPNCSLQLLPLLLSAHHLCEYEHFSYMLSYLT